jgi:transketolase
VDGDGNDTQSFRAALDAARKEPSRPSLIKLRTRIGYGSPHKEGTAEVHGSPLGDAEVALTKQRLGWNPGASFEVPPDVQARFRSALGAGAERERQWNDLFVRYAAAFPAEAAEATRALARELPSDWEDIWKQSVPFFDPLVPLATREAQGKVLDAIMPHLPLVLGGSADLTPSNNTRFKGAVDFSTSRRDGRYLHYGVREHAMGAIMNGIAVSDLLIPYGATFFCFSDYMRPAIRLAALSHYSSIFVFTHESIGLGEDGPTHQAVEHFAALRSMPGLTVFRPADANETAQAWKFALEHREGPTVITLTRQKVPVIDQARFGSAVGVARGAYVLTGEAAPQLLLLATGSEVSLALAAHERLAAEGIRSRVVSMPSWELFESQPAAYRDEVLPPGVRARVAVEAGVQFGWERYLGTKGIFVGMKQFGASAPAEVSFREFGITVEAVVAAARTVLDGGGAG